MEDPDSVVNDTAEQFEKLRKFVEDWGGVAREVAETAGDAVGKATDPVCLVGAPTENLRLEDMAVTINPAFSKLIVIFAHLSTEIARLRRVAEDSLFPALVLLGEYEHVLKAEEPVPEGETQLALARTLTQLQDVVLFLEQVNSASCNLFAQLSALYVDITRVYAPLQAVRLSTAFISLGNALSLAAGLDEAVRTNAALPTAFASFRRMLAAMRAEPSRFSAGENDIEGIESAITTLEDRLMTADAFDNILDKLVVPDADGGLPQHFLDQLTMTAVDGMQEMVSRLSTEEERPVDRQNLVALMCLVVLHSRLVPLAVDKKMCAAVWELQKNVVMLPVSTMVFIYPVEFLCRYLPPAAIELGPADPLTFAQTRKQAALERLDSELPKEMTELLKEGASWIACLESSVPSTGENMDAVLGPRVRLLSNGIFIAARLRYVLQVTIQLHMDLDEPMSKAELRLLSQAAELLQGILSAYNRRKTERALELPHLLSFALGRLSMLVAPARQVLEEALASVVTGWSRVQSTLAGRGTGADAARQDAVAAATLAERILTGPPTIQRLMLIRLCFDTLAGAYVMSDDTTDDADELIELTDLIADLEVHSFSACDTSFLYRSRELLPACLSDIYSRPDEANRIPLLVSAFSASECLLYRGEAPGDLHRLLEDELLRDLEECIILPLCHDIESDLRLHIHSARLTGVVEVNPFRSGFRDLSKFLGVLPLRLATVEVDIRSRVIQYLNAAFHNHTAISLHNWKTYGEMRNLAMEKYRIPLAEIELPGQTLEEGLDILEIMRNIHIFVARYNYNLNSQCFIEKPAYAQDRKHLNTISIRHVANSIRTHGTGVTHTTINFVYQYLAQRFHVFSQFLFDDHIKSMLMKESRAFHVGFTPQSKSSMRKQMGSARARVAAEEKQPPRKKQQYPMDRAVKFNKGIRKLGSADDGSSFLDQFRLLITEIGNALGFVRMVRLGVMHYCTNAAKFVPSLTEPTSNFATYAEEDGLSDATVDAAKSLDAQLELLRDQSAEGTDFFQVLVNVFTGELRNESNQHLKDFYLILPALSLNAVEFILSSKEKLTRRGKESQTACFTDDGFALGVAFILRVLDQGTAYDSLHWNESVAEFYKEEKARESTANTDTMSRWSSENNVAEEQANTQIRLGRLKGMSDEFTLLRYCLQGARTFFNHS